MADIERSDQQHPNLHLSPDERRLFGQLFAQADTDKIGVVTGERAVSFFEKTRLPSDVLGEIWQIADEENRGLLTPAGFGIVLRLIGYAQAGRAVSRELALKPGGPLPRFDGISAPGGPPPTAAPLQAQNSGPIRVPPLTGEKVSQYASLFEESGAQNGMLSGETAKSIFERAQLPNEVLGRIWTLADTEQKGALGLTEFIIAMHLLASMKNGSMRALPQILPAGLYEAAARRGGPRQNAGSRPKSDAAPTAIPRQLTGQGYGGPQRAGTGFQQQQGPGYNQRPMSPAGQWAVSPQDKSQFDSIFATIDTQNRGFITGDQAVGFFSNSRLPEDALAQIWDLADINSEGQLNKDEFAVAMYLIRQQRSKTTDRDVLPKQLPPNLIPPSMRRQPIPPQQPTAPTFDNAANISVPKPASEDLFGLDAFSTAPSTVPLQPKSTGDSSAYQTPPRNQASPPPISSGPTTHFKPFMPSSSFGQTIMTPQGTGTSDSTASPALNRGMPSQQKQPNAMDDLLGDNDPEVSNKLTSETSDLANLSNQVSSLTGQMQDIKNKRGPTEQELSQTQNQKTQFEGRLAQLRSAYEQEVREVHALEERLKASRGETQKLQSDMAMIQGTYEDLQNQHRSIGEALSSDQNENANLKERIRQTSTEIEQLKPQLEKLRSAARHQKGLVAINKKQLATQEAEREKVRGDMAGASEEHAEATRDLEQSQRDLESGSQTRAPPVAASSATTPAPAVASPAPSSASMNPFFRRQSNPPPATEKGAVTSPFTPPNVASPNHNAFDSFFGPSAATTSAPPPTSFRSDSPGMAREASPGPTPSNQSYDGTGSMSGSRSPQSSTFSNTPAAATEPPAPPQSRQITSSFLPFRPNLETNGSDTSSVRVIPPASRAGDRSETPTNTQSDETSHESPIQHFQDMAAKAPQGGASQLTPPSSQQTPEIKAQEATAPESTNEMAGLPSAPRDVPGAFPGDETPLERSQPDLFASTASPYGGSGIDPRVDALSGDGPARTQSPSLQPGTSDPFAKASTPTSAKDDFDSAFAGFSTDKGKTPEQGNGAVSDDPFGAPSTRQPKGEFPPIQEFGADDESDSDSEKGFDDDFTARSANRTKESGPNQALQGQAPLVGQNDALAPSRPPFETANSNSSQLPTPGAQGSPPTYDQTVSSPTEGFGGDRKGSNQFPAQYSGLLPSRDDPTSPPTLSPQTSTTQGSSNINSSAGIDRGLNFFPEETNSEQTPGVTSPGSTFSKDQYPMAPGSSTNAPFAYSQTSPPSQQPTSQSQPATIPAKPKDDFDDFEDLAPAQEEDEKGDDTIDFSRQDNGAELDFNPTFDSPVQSSSHAAGPSQSSSTIVYPPTTDAFSNFTSSSTAAPSAPPQQQQQKQFQPQASASHDWDAIFAGLDSTGNSGAPQRNGAQGPELSFPSPGKQDSSAVANGGLGGGSKATTSVLPRQESTGGADDDPILQRLMGMGFERQKSLGALEMYDYNIDKAAEHLLSKS